MSTLNVRPSGFPRGLPSLVWLFSLYWFGIRGISGIGLPLPKSLGSVVIFCEYLLFTISAVRSAFWGLSRGASPMFCLDRLDSLEGRAELDSVAAPNPVPTGMGALICRGALIVGGPPFLGLSPRFLRREMPPFGFSDILPARLVFLESDRVIVSLALNR